MAQQSTDGRKAPVGVATTEVVPDDISIIQPSLKDRLWSLCPIEEVPRNLWLSISIMMILTLANSILIAPDKRLLESAICRKFYDQYSPGLFPPTASIPESWCKEPEIQSSFASFTSIMSAEASVIDLLVSVPLGRLADRKGFRLVLLINTFFSICYWAFVLVIGQYSHVLPLWLYYLAPLLGLPGGSATIVSTLVFAIISKAVPSSQRTAAFARLYGFTWFAMVIAPIVGSMLMSMHLGLPFVVAIGTMAVACIPIGFLTPSKKIEQRADDNSTNADASDDPTQPLLQSDLQQDKLIEDDFDHFIEPQGSWFKFVEGMVCSNDQTLLFGMLSQVLVGAASTSKTYLLSYVSLRFVWSMAEAGYLLTIMAVVSLLVYMFILPMSTSLMSQRWGMTQFRRDIRISQFSLVLQSIGYILIGLAPHPIVVIMGIVIYGLGAGGDCSLTSALSSLVDNKQAGQLFATFSIFDTLAISAGLPFMGYAYSWASDKSHSLTGLPFLLAGGLVLAALMSLLGMKLARR